jgi:hypothetical protein
VITGDLGVAKNGHHKDSFTPGMELRGKYTLFAEGARGSLSKQLGVKFGLQDGRELLSADTRARHRLGGPSSVQTSLTALVKQDLLLRETGRHVVVDSLLREWVARKTF